MYIVSVVHPADESRRNDTSKTVRTIIPPGTARCGTLVHTAHSKHNMGHNFLLVATRVIANQLPFGLSRTDYTLALTRLY